MFRYTDNRLTQYVYTLFKNIKTFSDEEYLPKGDENPFYKYLQVLSNLEEGREDFKDGFFFNLGSSKKIIIRYTNFTNQGYTMFDFFRKFPSSETLSGYKEIQINDVTLTIYSNGSSNLNGNTNFPFHLLHVQLVNLIDTKSNFLQSERP